MPAFTPIYGWPFQSLTDPPDGPNLGEDLALAIEATVKTVDNSRITGDAALALLAPKYSARQVLVGSVATVLFSGIPANLRKLCLAYTARCDNAVQVQQLFFRINGDSAANYNYEYMQGNNVTASAVAGAAQTQGVCGVLTAASATGGVYGSGEVTFVGWDSPHSTGLGYTFLGQGMGTAAANFFTQMGGGIYLANGPYTSLTLLPTAGLFIVGSDFQLIGW